MLGQRARYFVRHPLRTAAAILADPREAWTSFLDRCAARLERRTSPDDYKCEVDWERRVHQLINVPWPCGATAEFWALWSEAIRQLEANGIRAGPESFKGWNDGDAGLVRAIWCLSRHLRPSHVVETGVAHGLTSRFILEALERNGAGHLWSIDHQPLEHFWREQVAMAVGGRFPHRWTYIKGSSRRQLPGFTVDLFVHPDSLHSEHNVRFEVDSAWAILRPGGVLVIDDVDVNRGFHSFTEVFPGHEIHDLRGGTPPP